MSFELPLFPLNIVLLPGMALPLHIFEPRYRLMIRRVLEADKTFGVCLLAAGEEGQGGTQPHEFGCSCEILEATPLPDGRFNVQTVGRRRFRVLSTREEDEYLIGNVEWLDDDDSASSDELTREVREKLRRYLTLLAQNTQMSGFSFDDLDIADDPYGLSMAIAALLSLPSEGKQQLLELTSTTTRLEFESAWLERAGLVQQAYARREEPTATDEPAGPLAGFVSLN